MTLPVSPNQIAFSQVNTELALASTTQISLDQASVRTLAGVPSGQIGMSNLHGKSNRVYATWNPADAANLTFSNGNLTLTDAAAGLNGTRSTISKSSGKWYWEITFNSFVNIRPGVANSNWTLTTSGGGTANNYAFISGPNSLIRGNNTSTAAGLAMVTGDVIGIALDASNGNVSYYRNNTLMAATAYGQAGPYFAAISLFDLADNVTANFGATALVYTPPAGYNAGLYS